MPAAPSTAAPNPLKTAMASIVGTDPLSTTTGTSDLLNYEGGGGFRPPEGDVIAITGDPGTGATTAETWAHQIALENQKQDLLQFQFEKGLKEQEEARQAGMYGPQLAAANLANQTAQQQYALNQAAENRAAQEFYLKTTLPQEIQNRASAAQMDYNRFMTTRGPDRYATATVTPQGTQAYHEYLAAGRPANTYFNPSDERWRYSMTGAPSGGRNTGSSSLSLGMM